MLRPDGTGEMISGYGQTIHAHILCRWALLPANRLAVTYLESPAKRAGAFFQGYSPPADRPPRVLEYRLTEGPVTGRCGLTGRPFEYRWTLEFEAPPWPEDVRLPPGPVPPGQPRVFYGHTVAQEKPPAS